MAAGIGIAVAVGVAVLVAVGSDGPGPGAGADGRTFYVSGRGSDDSPGSRERPWRTLAFAFERLRPGDTLLLREGAYLEQPTLAASGTADAPITVRSHPGETAVIDSGPREFRDAGNQDWELVDAATGEYRSVRPQPSDIPYAYVDGVPGYANRRVLLIPYQSAEAFRATGDAYVDEETPFYAGPGVFYDERDERIHIRLAKTDDLKAAEARYGTVFDSDLPDPRQHRIILSSAPATLTVDGSHLVIRDLTVHQAKETVLLTSEAHHVRFDGITAWTGDRAIQADGEIHHVTVTGSRIYGDNPRWLFWSDMKNPPAPADLVRSTAINLEGGAYEWEISYNHVRGSGQDLIGTNTDERRILIHHNRLESCGDDALELEGTTDVGEIRVYENFIGNCLVAVGAGQDTPSFSGPLYVFRNVVALLQNPPVNREEGINDWNGGGRFGYEYLFKQHSGNTHIYHNTLVLLNHAGRGINLVPELPAGTVVANNLAVVVNGRADWPGRAGPGQVLAGNLHWAMNPSGPGSSIPGTDPRFVGFSPDVVDRAGATWELVPGSEDVRPSDFRLGPGSPAIDAGITIPAHPRLGRLPDTRSSRDVGALPFGVPPDEYDVFPFVAE